MEPRSGRRRVHLPLDEEVDHCGIRVTCEALREKQVRVGRGDPDTCEIALPLVVDVLGDEEACARSDGVGEDLSICALRAEEPFGIRSGRRELEPEAFAQQSGSRRCGIRWAHRPP